MLVIFPSITLYDVFLFQIFHSALVISFHAICAQKNASYHMYKLIALDNYKRTRYIGGPSTCMRMYTISCNSLKANKK